MLFICHGATDPYFNLAAEEYVLEKGEGAAFLLWRNGPSVIIGKNQNAFAQLRLPFVQANHIQVARRLTGGGAVFHDLGNINFTFITDASEHDQIDFARFTAPIIANLKQFGVAATLNGRNDLLAVGRKISGNAQCVYHTEDGRRRLLHHGTLLFSADLSRLSGALQVNREKMESKGIESVVSRVANIRELPGYGGGFSAKFGGQRCRRLWRRAGIYIRGVCCDSSAGRKEIQYLGLDFWPVRRISCAQRKAV